MPIQNYLLLTLIFLSAGCVDFNSHVNLIASRKLNPDAMAQSLPVLIRVYELKDKKIFENASFHDLWTRDKKLLKHNLISRQEITLSPGQLYSLKLSNKKGKHFIGFFAVFRNPGRGGWRVTKEFYPWSTTTIWIQKNKMAIKN